LNIGEEKTEIAGIATISAKRMVGGDKNPFKWKGK